MNGEQYILSFDLSEINRQIAELQNSYTTLTNSFKYSASDSADQLRVIENSVKEISSSLDASFTKMTRFYTGLLGNLESTTAYFEKLQGSSKSVTDNLMKLQNVDLSRLKSGSSDATAAERLSAISPKSDKRFSMTMSISAETDEIAEEALKKAEKAIQAAQKAFKEAQESQGLILDTAKKLTDTIKKDLKSGKSAMMGIASKASMGVIGGGAIAGLLGMMILGVQEGQRKGAERGEMKNVFEGIGDMFSKESKRAVGWFSRFAEKAQWYFGIGRKEIQSVVKQMVDSGYKSGEILTDFSKNINDVEANVTTLSIGLDKHTNQATGTSMQNMIKLVTQYGDSIDSAADKYKRLTFEAQRSGMGVNKFIDAIMSGSSALTQYGIEMEDVVEVMGKMQEYYKSMGLKDQFAGGQAAQAVKGIVGGIASLDEGTMAALAQRMFGALGLNALDALQMFKEGAARVAKGENKDFLIDAAQQLRSMADEVSGGKRSVGIRFLESRGLSNQQATALYDVADKLEKGTKIEELSAKEQKALTESFKTEGEQLTELQKTQRSLIEGLSKMGEGILKMLTSFLGVLVVGIKGILSAVLKPTLDPDEIFKRLVKYDTALNEQLSGLGEGFDLFIEGGKKTGAVVGGALDSVNKNLSKALALDMGGGPGVMQRLDEISSAVADIQRDSSTWVEELQASFNARMDVLAEQLRLITPQEKQVLAESDNERLSKMHAAQRVRATISSNHQDKSESKRRENRVK